jgi:hypothetical protein
MTGLAGQPVDADRVTLSRNETESLCMKAARGAGFSWGLAEEAGVAAGWLAAQGIDGATPVLALLTRKLGRPAEFGRPRPMPGHWRSVGDGPLCPIQLGAALIDRASLADGPFCQDTHLDPVETPLLLLPFLVRGAQICQISLAIDEPSGRLHIQPDGTFSRQNAVIWAGQTLLALDISASSTLGEKTLATGPVVNLPSVLISTLDGLGALALRTTVPATNASRSGAGSATSDND